MARFRLRIELMPEPLWGQNLRSNVVGLGPGRWLKLSQQVRKRIGKCSVCGRTERLHGHEVWQYAERARSGTAKLIDVSVICTICHSINHWGRISALIAAGIMKPADGRRLIRHFVKINRCMSKASFERHRIKAFAEWRERNRKKWKIDWGPYAPAITEAKAARALNRSRRQAAAARRSAAQNITTVAGAT
jgi:hypothetical protein